MREKAIERLLSNWRELVRTGEFDAEEMRMSIEVQAHGGCQGWDASMEELEIDPELHEIMGYDWDLTDEQTVEWREIVIEAAKRYLEEGQA